MRRSWRDNLESPNAAWNDTGADSSRPARPPPSSAAGIGRSRLEGRRWIAAQTDLTLAQLQERLRRELEIDLSITALWHRLRRLGLSFKKRCTLPSKSVLTLPPPEALARSKSRVGSATVQANIKHGKSGAAIASHFLTPTLHSSSERSIIARSKHVRVKIARPFAIPLSRWVKPLAISSSWRAECLSKREAF